jgi:hypothetical protein
MNIANVAVSFALLGWYLMVPPQPLAKYWERPPLSKWENVGSFDTAKECERYKNDRAFEIGEKGVQGTTETEKQLFTQFTVGQCIASDDPRLAK